LSADLSFTIYLCIFFRQLPSELAERNSAKTRHVLRIECDLKMYIRNLGIPSPYKSGPQNAFFRRLRNFTATLTAYIFRMKHDIDNWLVHLTTTRGLLHRLKMTWTLVHKRLKIGRPFYPPYPNSAFYFIARLNGDQQTKLNQTLASGGQ